MQLLHKNGQYHIENSEFNISIIFEEVNKLIEQKDTVFSHLVIDEVEVYDNHEEYIVNNLREIDKIEIITRNTQEMIWETMESIHVYLERAIPALNNLIEKSYENFSAKSWEGINQLAEGMQWILQFVEFTQNANKKPSHWEDIEKSIKLCEESFSQLMEGVEMQDTVLISDILTYEILPAYESLKEHLEKSLLDEEYLKNVN